MHCVPSKKALAIEARFKKQDSFFFPISFRSLGNYRLNIQKTTAFALKQLLSSFYPESSYTHLAKEILHLGSPDAVRMHILQHLLSRSCVFSKKSLIFETLIRHTHPSAIDLETLLNVHKIYAKHYYVGVPYFNNALARSVHAVRQLPDDVRKITLLNQLVKSYKKNDPLAAYAINLPNHQS